MLNAVSLYSFIHLLSQLVIYILPIIYSANKLYPICISAVLEIEPNEYTR